MIAQPLDLKRLLKVPYVDPESCFDLSPNGEKVAFSFNLTGRWQIYLMPLEGSQPPQKITSGPGAKFAPRWSPDGSRIAYLLDRDGREGYDIYVYDLASGRHTNLMPDSPDLVQPRIVWSPDGTQIAFISNRSGTFDTYIIPVTGGKPYSVFAGQNPDWDVRWSPDGHWLAIASETGGQDLDVTCVPLDGGKPRPLADSGDIIHGKDPCWSPDGKSLAFASNDQGHYEIGIFDLQSEIVTWVTMGEGEKEFPAWSPNGRQLTFVISEGPVNSVGVLDLKTGILTKHQVGVGVHYFPRFVGSEEKLIVNFDNPSHPCNLWLLSLEGAGFTPLTTSLPTSLQALPFVMPISIHYPSLDGALVPGLLYRPEEISELPPAVVYIHGGPTWLTQVTWDPMIQHMVSKGWVVLAPNYRGSKGYGRSWQLANRYDLGGGDAADISAAADYLIREELADPTRIGVTGVSYGGYLTMTAMTRNPERWAVGSAVVPFLNWFSTIQRERQDLKHWDGENFGNPEENHDRFYERSPFFFLDHISAPVQMICGANDQRCPAIDSIKAHEVLISQGKRCDLVIYPDEGHSFLKLENFIDAKIRRVRFLSEVLEIGPQ